MTDEEAPKRRVKKVAVRVVRAAGAAAIVEHGDPPRRTTVPAAEVQDDKVGEDVLEAGAPYGADWERWIKPASARRIADNLRRHGIWTRDDLMRMGREARQAIYECCGAALKELIEGSKED